MREFPYMKRGFLMLEACAARTMKGFEVFFFFFGGGGALGISASASASSSDWCDVFSRGGGWSTTGLGFSERNAVCMGTVALLQG